MTDSNKPKINIPKKTKMGLAALFGVICILAIIAVIMFIKNSSKDKTPTAHAIEEDTSIPVEGVPISSVRHITFSQLCVKKVDGCISVDEFKEMLQMLYDQGFVLIDVYSLAEVAEDGTMSMKSTVNVPKGKRPLIISQIDVSYPISKQSPNYAKCLVVDSNRDIKCEYINDQGSASMGDFDLVPAMETFISEHPDFSYSGARGVLGLTGYNGVFGYRTSDYLGKSENNPYGTFNTGNEKNAAEAVIELLKEKGWRFASNGFANVSYGSEYSMVESDVRQWEEQVEPVVGDTDILIMPRSTDIGSWAPYNEANPKYTLLKEAGFKYFIINDHDTLGFLQVEKDYLREATYEVNNILDIQNATAE